MSRFGRLSGLDLAGRERGRGFSQRDNYRCKLSMGGRPGEAPTDRQGRQIAPSLNDLTKLRRGTRPYFEYHLGMCIGPTATRALKGLIAMYGKTVSEAAILRGVAARAVKNSRCRRRKVVQATAVDVRETQKLIANAKTRRTRLGGSWTRGGAVRCKNPNSAPVVPYRTTPNSHPFGGFGGTRPSSDFKTMRPYRRAPKRNKKGRFVGGGAVRAQRRATRQRKPPTGATIARIMSGGLLGADAGPGGGSDVPMPELSLAGVRRGRGDLDDNEAM